MIKSAALFTSTAMGLLVLGAPLCAAPALPANPPDTGVRVLVQESVKDAQARLRAARKNLQDVTDAGGDVGAAQAEVDAAQQALEAAQGAAAEGEAQRAAEEEAAKQKAAEEEAARQAEAEAQKAAEEEAARKAAEEAEAAKAAEEEAARKAAEEAEAQKAAEEAEAAKAAEEEAARKAAEEAEAAKAAEDEAAKQKASEEAEAAKAAEEEAARKAAEEAEKAKEQQPAEQSAQPETPAEQPAQPEAPAAEQPAQPEAPAEQPAQPEAPTAEQPAEPEQPAGEQPAQPEAPAREQPAQPEPPAQPEAPAGEQPAQPEQPAGEQPAQPEAPAEQPAQPDQTQAPAPEDLAPVLDSQKAGDAPAAPAPGEAQPQQPEGQAQQPEVAAPAEPPPPPPADDKAAQPADVIVNIAPVIEEKAVGERRPVERVEETLVPVDVFPEPPKVIERVVGGLILQFGDQIIVERSDRERLSRRAEDVYVEELRNGRTRETIVKPDGVQIITVRNRWGEIIRRSRIEPDGSEYVLVYAPYLEEERERPQEWYDPGRDLPPMRLTIPVREYILDAGEADEDEFVEFLSRPPVEKVERLYSIDEVRRSARIRDKVRRVDLDNITFETGSANVSAKGIRTLQGVADAMADMIGKNPAESFLIEGHTDAVGSDVSNLSLSDQRAEAVAVVLTEVYRIPAENLVTQGYGERYLKVKTQEAERLNRRVAIRRISTLVAPEVASR